MSRNRLASAALPYVVAIGALFLYTVQLGRSSLWFDEAATYQFARLDWATLSYALHHGDAFYGLYYAFMHLWIAIAGSSETALRLPSAVFAAAALPLVFHLARRLFGNATAWVTLFGIACNPFYYSLARNARPYPLFFFVAVAASIMFLRAVERKTRTAWLAYTAVSVVGIYTHLFTVFVIIAHGLYVLIRSQRAVWRPYLLSAAICELCTVPLAYFTLNDENSQNTWLTRPTLHTVRELVFVWSGSHNLEHLQIALIIFTAAIVLWNRPRERNPAFADGYTFALCLLFVPLIFVFIISQKKPIYYPNYMIAELIAFTLLYSRGIALLGLRRAFVPALFVLLILDASAIKVEATNEMQNWRGAAAALITRAEPGDAIILFPARGFAALEYYAPTLSYSKGGVTTVYPHEILPIWRSELEPFAPNRLAGDTAIKHRRVWLVWNGLSGQIEPGALQLQHALARYYRFGARQQFTRIEIIELTAKQPVGGLGQGIHSNHRKQKVTDR